MTLSLAVLVGSVTAIPASANPKTLNLRPFLCSTDLAYFHSVIPQSSCVYGTYGVPASYNTRLVKSMQYVKGFYSYHGVTVNYNFSTSQIVNTPASQSAGSAPDYTNRVVTGCYDCYFSGLCSACISGGRHHSSEDAFGEAIPSFNSSNEIAMMITGTQMCTSTSTGKHTHINGVALEDKNAILVGDYDYRYAGISDYEDIKIPYKFERMVMVHEIGHFYDVNDHYSSATAPGTQDDCIWGANRFSFSVMSNCQCCATCSSTIFANNSRYNHTP